MKAATTHAWMRSAHGCRSRLRSLDKTSFAFKGAVAQTSGPDHWELERNRIYLDDQIFAELSLSKPNKWFLVYVWACRRSPE